MRLEASKGYWHLCCTPTKGQQYFRDIFEGKTQLPDALVLVVSLYDATKYDDGTAGQYTLAEVKRRESLLANEKGDPTSGSLAVLLRLRVWFIRGLTLIETLKS